MYTCYILARAMVKGANLDELGAGSLLKKKKTRKLNLSGPGKIVLFLFVAAYVSLVFGSIGSNLTQMILAGGLDLGTAVLILLTVPLTFLFISSFMYITNLCYFSKDIETYLVLPVHPWQIVVARLATVYTFEIGIELLFFLPGAVTMGYLLNLDVGYYFAIVVIALGMPIIPLSFVSCITIPLMRFTKWAHHRDRFNLISNILFIIIFFGVSYFTGFHFGSGKSPHGMMFLLVNKIYKIPGISFATWAVGDVQESVDWLMLLGYLVVIGLYIAVMVLIANLFYIKGAMDGQVVTAKRQKLTQREYTKYDKKQSVFFAMLQRENRIVLRTPSFFIQYMLINFLMIGLILVVTILGIVEDGSSIAILRDSAKHWLNQPENLEKCMSFALIFTPVAGFMLGGMNGLSTSSFTREGKQGKMLLSYPITMKKLIWVKIVYFMLCNLSGLILMFIFAWLFFEPPWQISAIVILSLILSTMFINFIGFILDMMYPKLNWEHEMQAAKQNYNILLESLISWLLAGAYGFLVYSLLTHLTVDLTQLAIGLCVSLLLCNVLAYLLIKRLSPVIERKLGLAP